jgi:cell division protein FtsB
VTPEAPVRTDSFRPVLGATVLLVLALLAIAALKSSRDLEAARARERLLETRIAATRAESERLLVRVERLRYDPGMLERLAREDLGMVRPGDVIVELPSSQPPRPPVPAMPPGPPAPQVPVPTVPASQVQQAMPVQASSPPGANLSGSPRPEGTEGTKIIPAADLSGPPAPPQKPPDDAPSAAPPARG